LSFSQLPFPLPPLLIHDVIYKIIDRYLLAEIASVPHWLASVWNMTERKFRSGPHLIDTGDLLFIYCVGERPGADAVYIATVVDKTAGGIDGPLGAWVPLDEVCRVFPILKMPRHSK
jgi:hypothetical protein